MTSHWFEKSVPVYHDATTTDTRWWCLWCRKMVDTVVTSEVGQEVGVTEVKYSCPECKHLFQIVYEEE